MTGSIPISISYGYVFIFLLFLLRTPFCSQFFFLPTTIHIKILTKHSQTLLDPFPVLYQVENLYPRWDPYPFSKVKPI